MKTLSNNVCDNNNYKLKFDDNQCEREEETTHWLRYS